MPLQQGSSSKVIGQNIKEMESSGHPYRQALAAALHTANVKKKGLMKEKSTR